MLVIRLGLALAGLGGAMFFGYEAYWTLAVPGALPGTGSTSLRFLGVTVPFSIGLAVLVALALASAFLAAYVLFLHRSDS